MTKVTVQLREFAEFVGAHGKKTEESALPFHKAFVAATPEQQGEMRNLWIAGHLTGQKLDAEKIMALPKAGSKGRCRSREQQRAYDRARADFSYHVVRAKKAKKTEPVKAPRISRGERAAWAAFIAIVGADRAALIAKTLG